MTESPVETLEKAIVLTVKVCIEFVTIWILFYVLVFLAARHVGILVPRPGIKPTPPALEGKVLTIEPPGRHHPS